MLKAKLIRIEQGLSQIEVARRAKMNPTTISKIEHGMKPWPGQAARIAAALGWDGELMELFEEREEKQ